MRYKPKTRSSEHSQTVYEAECLRRYSASSGKKRATIWEAGSKSTEQTGLMLQKPPLKNPEIDCFSKLVIHHELTIRPPYPFKTPALRLLVIHHELTIRPPKKLHLHSGTPILKKPYPLKFLTK
ncbi:MAG: hypothetical protein PHQ65_14000 [Bacteroidales bacterium]|nr:hypothetical protein [Bacteroidales bacterium]MDD3666373.1 hypothetical protein [Bacteroidales bacterium]